MKYLGIDYGTKKIGLALSDKDGRVAFPHEVILSDNFAPSVIADFVYKEEVESVVIGESRNLDGNLNDVALEVDKFVKKLREFTNVQIYFEDERFSTRQTANLPREELSRGNIANRKNDSYTAKDLKDKYAAAIILQSFLDKRNLKS